MRHRTNAVSSRYKEITDTVDSSDNSRQLSPEEITDVKDWVLGLDFCMWISQMERHPTKSMQEEKAIHSISITEKKYFPICISMTTMFLSMVFGGKSF